MSLQMTVGVALIGGAGAVARMASAGTLARSLRGSFPEAVTVVNLAGAFALGVLDGAAVSGDALTLAGTGFLGAYTTFSAWVFESQRLAAHGRRPAALLNIAFALVAGLALFWLGREIA